MPQAKTSRGAVPLERCSNRALFPLSMNQRDMWFQGQIHAQKGLNNVCVQVNLEGALNVSAEHGRRWLIAMRRCGPFLLKLTACHSKRSCPMWKWIFFCRTFQRTHRQNK